MTELIVDRPEGRPTPVLAVWAGEQEAALTSASPTARSAAAVAKFAGKSGQIVIAPSDAGGIELVLAGLGERRAEAASSFRALAAILPAGEYRIEGDVSPLKPQLIPLAWAQGGYRFDRYKSVREHGAARLVVDLGADALAEARQVAHALALARDMVNAPANDMGPLQIETIAREIAEAHGAAMTVAVGEALVDENYPAVRIVGAAAPRGRAPRMIEITWGEADAPMVALVGKGVTFDSGGLDLKPAAGMRLMKKDMGGAAHALALGRMLMAHRASVRLVILIPAVDNAISAEAMRPGDVIPTRAGLTVEIGNTDAEGRLILADALARARELAPDLTIDLATLTGAARVALGPQVPPFYTPNEDLAAALARASEETADPIWRLPLWAPYAAALDSDIADIKNDPDAWAQAGSVTAALFLQRFAPAGAWAHFDIFAWNPRPRPGFPQGAEAQAILAIYAAIKARYA
ncbi:MAG TPA: leucyl aminopeptidase family protein [Caulobacteraceae bacterium]|nr:leucyl aminopeptidase family protein [Caulobacteraceae bacterium]